MPRLTRDFPPTEPAAIGTYSIDFAANVPPGASLVSAQWTLGIHAALSGAIPDPAPQSRLSGPSMVNGTLALQRIAGLFDGNDYLAVVTGAMSDGEVVVLWTVLPCRAPA